MSQMLAEQNTKFLPPPVAVGLVGEFDSGSVANVC